MSAGFHVVVISSDSHVWFRMWVNGGLCSPHEWCLRLDEFDEFMRRLKPETTTGLKTIIREEEHP